jgi:hypothetical protein
MEKAHRVRARARALKRVRRSWVALRGARGEGRGARSGGASEVGPWAGGRWPAAPGARGGGLAVVVRRGVREGA